MAKRANQFFVSFVGGRRRFEKDALVPDDVAAQAPELVYDDQPAPEPKPTKRAAPRA